MDNRYINIDREDLNALTEKWLRVQLRTLMVEPKMSKWVQDLRDMHNKFGFHETIAEFDNEKLKAMLEFRVKFLEEELNEIKDNMDNPEEIVDGLIDLCVVAIGTLDLFQIDSEKAWDAVHRANMSKERGIKKERPNPLGLPDLMKPEGWEGPSHEGNHGILPV